MTPASCFCPGDEPYVLAVLTEPEPIERSPHGAHRPRFGRRLRVAHVMSHFPLPIVDGFELDAPVRSLLMPGVTVRDSHARLRRLPRFFYAVESWNVALETQLTPHFAMWEFMDVDLFEPAPLRRFPRYVPCAVTVACRASRGAARADRIVHSYLRERRVSIAVAWQVDPRFAALLGHGRQHLSHWRCVSRRARGDRKVRGAGHQSAPRAARAPVRAGTRMCRRSRAPRFGIRHRRAH